MVGPQMAHDVPAGDMGPRPGGAPAIRELAGRNPAIVFLESLLPWNNFGDNRDGHLEDHDQGIN